MLIITPGLPFMAFSKTVLETMNVPRVSISKTVLKALIDKFYNAAKKLPAAPLIRISIFPIF